MCRNIKTLHHFEPPCTREEVEASALQYVRKLTGMHHGSHENQEVFDAAVRQVRDVTLALFDALHTHGPPRSREIEKEKAIARGKKREEQMRARFAKATA